MRVALACSLPLLLLAGLWTWAAGRNLDTQVAAAILTLIVGCTIFSVTQNRARDGVDTLRALSDGVLMTAPLPVAGWPVLILHGEGLSTGLGGLITGLIGGLLGAGLHAAWCAFGPTERAHIWLRPKHPTLSEAAIARKLAEAFLPTGRVPPTMLIQADNAEGSVSLGHPLNMSDGQEKAFFAVARDIARLARTRSFPQDWSLGHVLILPTLSAHDRLRLEAKRHA